MSRDRAQSGVVLAVVLASLMMLSLPTAISPIVESGFVAEDITSLALIDAQTPTPTFNHTENNSTVSPPVLTTATPEPDGASNTTQVQSQRNLARDLRAIRNESRSQRVAAMDITETVLVDRQQMVADGRLDMSLESNLATQQTNLVGAHALLNISESDTQADSQSNNLTRAVRLAKVGMELQVSQLNASDQPTHPTAVTLPEPPTPNHGSPSAAAFAILNRYNVTLTADEATDIRALDDLPEPARSELTDVLDAYHGYYLTTKAAYADANRSQLRALTNASDMDLQAAGNGSLGASGTGMSIGVSPATLNEAGVDVPQVRAAQVRLLQATMDLNAAPSHPDDLGLAGPASHDVIGENVSVRVPGNVSIDLSGHDNTYMADYNLQIDVGGNDTYNNNAGGGNGGAGALVDLGGNDTYNGRNGGGRLGAGFLLDASGEDTYTAGDSGTNGGGELGGVGFLLDAAGSDTYTAGDSGTNGGGNAGIGFLLDAGENDDNYTGGQLGVNGGGSFGGAGFLLDKGGRDVYTAQDFGTNGGGQGGVGFLLDAEGKDMYKATKRGTNGGGATGLGFLLDAYGSDTYIATDRGTNGGARGGGIGLLIDMTGDDRYSAGRGGVNGGAKNTTVIVSIPAVGILVDAGGDDFYTDDRIGECTNCERIPKGKVGVQIDRATTDNLPDEPPDPPSTTPVPSGDRCVEGLRDTCDGDGNVSDLEDNDGDTVYGTIQAAIEDANLNETIEVRPDTYHENVNVTTKNLTLLANATVAPGDVVLDGRVGPTNLPDGLDHGVEVRTSGVSIHGFVIQNYTSDEIVVTSDGDRSDIQNNTVHGSVAVAGSNEADLRTNQLTQNDSGHPALTVTNSTGTIVTNNVVNSGGIIVLNSTGTTVVTNEVKHISQDHGLGTTGTAGSTDTSTFSAAAIPSEASGIRPVGIEISGGSASTVTNNTVRQLSETGNGDGPIGIAVTGTGNATVTGNLIRNLNETGDGDGPLGIRFAASTLAAPISHNEVTGSEEGGEGRGSVGLVIADSALDSPMHPLGTNDLEGGGGLLIANSSVSPFNDTTFAGDITVINNSTVSPVTTNTFEGNVTVVNSTFSPLSKNTFEANVSILNDSVISQVTENTFSGHFMVVTSTVFPITKNTFSGNLTVVASTVSPVERNTFGGTVEVHNLSGLSAAYNDFTGAFRVFDSINVTVERNTFSGANLSIQTTSDTTIANNTFNGSSGALTLQTTHRTTVLHNTFRDLTTTSVPGRAVGITVIDGTDTTVAHNVLDNFGDGKYGGVGAVGILANRATNTTIGHNAISNFTEYRGGDGPTGIRIKRGSTTRVANNTIRHFREGHYGIGPTGIKVTNGTATTISNNEVTHFIEKDPVHYQTGQQNNEIFTDHNSQKIRGILLADSTTNILTHNRVRGLEAIKKYDNEIVGDPYHRPEGTGISLNETTNSRLQANDISAVNTSILVTSETPGAISITHNRFGGETRFGVRNVGQGILNATNNYWGDPTGPSSPIPGPTLADPETSGVANGRGTAVSEGGTEGVANVHFDPWLAVPSGGGLGGGQVAVEGTCDTVDPDGRTGVVEDADDDLVYGTLQSGVNAADPGTIIYVTECIYRETVTVDTGRITLKGIEDVVLTGGGTRARGVRIRAPAVTVRGFTVQNYTEAGISVYTDDVTIGENTVVDSNHGLELMNSDATVTNTTLRSNENGTVVYGTGAPHLVSNWFYNNSHAGLVLAANASATDLTLYHNRFQSNERYGVFNAPGNGIVNATLNHWGAYDAPSSPNGTTTLTDPETGTPANGSGDAVSTGTNGVSNVHFDPYNVVHYRWDIDYLVDDDRADCETEITSIQAVLSKTSSGDTVVVCAGTYPENVTVRPDHLTLRGSRYADKPEIRGLVDINTSGGGHFQTVRGFNISNPYPQGDGILVEAKYLTIAENNLSGNYRAIVRGTCGTKHHGWCGDYSLILNNNITRNVYGYHDNDKDSDNPSTLRGNLFVDNEKYGIFRPNGGSPGEDVTGLGLGALIAVNNTWECGGPSGGYRDPKTGRSANGTGDRISRGIRFDPFKEVSYTVINGEKVPCVRLDDPSFSPFPEGNNSAPEVAEFSVHEVETRNPDAEFNVDWRVEDSDGNLDEVELTLVDESTGKTIEEHTEEDAAGESENRVTRMVAASDDTTGHNYTVQLVVRDEAGNTSRATEAITETEPKDTPTASWPDDDTETPDDDGGGGGTGPGSGPGTGPGTGGSGGTNGTSTAGSGGQSTAAATAQNEAVSTVASTSQSTSTQTSTSTASTPPPSTPSVTLTPPLTPTPEVIPGFGMVSWLAGFGLLVGLLVARLRD